MDDIRPSNPPIQQQRQIVELGFQNPNLPNPSDPISPPPPPITITNDVDVDVVVLNQDLNNLALKIEDSDGVAGHEAVYGEALSVESSIPQAPIDDDTLAIETGRQDADTGANEHHIIPREEEGEAEGLQEKRPEGNINGAENKWSESEHEQGNTDNMSVKDEVERGEDACGNSWSGPENGEEDNDATTREANEEDPGIVTKYECQGRSENDRDDGGSNVEGDDDSVELKDEKRRRYHYPLRPDAEDCSYYMRMGTCKFGSSCKFNHPLRRRTQATKEMLKQKDENPERATQTECKYYTASGGCKYGNACRYNHSREKCVVAPVVEFNFLGLPIQQGEKECPYYMRNGSCKFGSSCRFNHPDPTAVGGGDPLSKFGSSSIQGGLQDTTSGWSTPRSLNETTPMMPYIYPPTTGALPKSEWDRYQAPVYPTSERSLRTPPAFSTNFAANDAKFYSQNQQQMQVEEYPERPGQPECSYYMRTGDCKYRSGCKFHHPKYRTAKTSSCAVSDQGLPLRPDQNICTPYVRYGICKFGPACKYDHPATYGNSASPDGSTLGQRQYGNTTTADREWERESTRQQSL